MNTRKALLTVAMAGILSSTSIISATSAFASDASPVATGETVASTSSAPASTADETPMLKTMNEALKALNSIQAARVALFNGSPDEALKLTDEAHADLKTANQSIDDYALKASDAKNADAAYIPFDTSMALTEGFIPDETDNAALSEASNLFSNGNESDAVETLKLADIDISVSAAMLPAQSSMKHLDEALTQLNEKQYYEANLSLKAVEDSVIVQQYDLFALPSQGSAS